MSGGSHGAAVKAHPELAPTLFLHHRADRRQVAIVLAYLAALTSMYLFPACRNVLVYVLALGLSFLNAVVIHNHMHKGIFRWRRLNQAFRCLLSFGALYPASANIPAHNIVHHHFDDNGRPDWVATEHVSLGLNIFNLIHFPNVAGPNTFEGIARWMRTTRQRDFVAEYYLELSVAIGATAVLMLHDFWTTLFFIVMPQLWGARCILRINLLQHGGTDTTSEWNHSRNFVGHFFNYLMCNNGFHTIHHNSAALHWAVLREVHDQEVRPRIDPSLDEPSMFAYVLRTFLLPSRDRDHRPLADEGTEPDSPNRC